MIRKMTCIICPNGCDLEAQVADRKCESVSGNLCPKGAQYAAQEVEEPKRTIASSVTVKNGVLPLTSVRLNRAVPKEKIFDVMEAVRRIVLNAPVHAGDIAAEDVLRLGSDLIVTKGVESREPGQNVRKDQRA